MKFYTNVFARGSKVYVRGYENNIAFSEVVSYSPYLFVDAQKDAKTSYRTLDGKPVEKRQFESIKEARDFVKRYGDVSNMKIYGLTNFPYMYIYDNYHGEMNYDVSWINIISLDIETDSGPGWTGDPNKKVKIRKL